MVEICEKLREVGLCSDILIELLLEEDVWRV